MKNTFLYIITVLIWGSTWIIIPYQLGDVAIEVSLLYRFFTAALIIFTLSLLKGLSLRFSLKQHFYIALLGLFNFCLNYVTMYDAQNYLSSAMASIAFSTLLLFNIVNTRIFFGKRIALKTYVGALTGIAGIIMLFWPELSKFKQGEGSLIGLVLVFSGTLLASFGNMISVRNSQNHYPVFQTSGWAMLYGSLFLLAISLYNQTEFTISTEPSYLLSFGFLSIFGTVIAFYSYFMLLKNIGPEKASYSIVLFPVVAVILSSLFEDFEWTTFTILGFLLVGSGNLLVLIPREKISGFVHYIFNSKDGVTKTTLQNPDMILESSELN